MSEPLTYFCDGTIDLRGRRSGVAVVVRDAAGRILDAASRQLGPMTSNEAEYEALILALELALRRGERGSLIFLSDSRNLVGQVAGLYAVRERRLTVRRACALELLERLPAATLAFVPRERNGIADALAAEACAGLTVWPARSSDPATGAPRCADRRESSPRRPLRG
jgi:ribonuclease HI